MTHMMSMYDGSVYRGEPDRFMFAADDERYPPLLQVVSILLLALLGWSIFAAGLYMLGPISLAPWVAGLAVIVHGFITAPTE